MKKRLFPIFAASCLVFAACDRKANSDETTSPSETSAENSPQEGFDFGAEDVLPNPTAQELGIAWANALTERDWEKLNTLFASDTTVVTHEAHLVNRVSTDVWKSQLAANKRAEYLRFELLAEFDHGRIPGGAALSANARMRQEEKSTYSNDWDLLVKNVDGKARVVGVWERLHRAKAVGAPNRHLGSTMVADGILLEPQPAELFERGYRTLLDPNGLAELWVDEGKLPLEWQRYKDKSFEIYDASGAKCTADVQGFRYYAQTQVPQWVTDTWTDQAGTKQGARDAGEAAWIMAKDQGHSLVAKFGNAFQVECPNPVFARMQGTPAFNVLRKIDNTEVSDDDVVAQAQELETTSQLMNQAGAVGAGDPFKSGNVEIRQFKSETEHYVSLSLLDGGACNDAMLTTFFLWKVTPQGWSLLNDPTRSRTSFVPEFAADIDGDGTVEFYGAGTVVRQTQGIHQLVEDARPVDFRTGC